MSLALLFKEEMLLDFVFNLQMTLSTHFALWISVFSPFKQASGAMTSDLDCPLQLVLNFSASAPAPTALCFAAVN